MSSKVSKAFQSVRGSSPHPLGMFFLAAIAVLLFVSALVPAHAREHKKTKKEDFGLGFTNEVDAPEADVIQAVQAVVNNGIIQGSREYNKDKFIEKAEPAEASPLFPAWTGSGKVFYKVREKVLAPTNFYESNDEGTLAVRYVVQSKNQSSSILRIDATFVEGFRHIAHPSDGTVESTEFADIEDRVAAIELDKKQTVEAARHRDEQLAQQALEHQKELDEATALTAAETSSDNLEQQVDKLRHQLERIIKAPGGDLKSAPFHTATTLKSLPPGSDVVILIVTSYWYGVETEEGEHGWIHRSQLEPLP